MKAEKGMASCQTGSERLPSIVGPFTMRTAFRVDSGAEDGSGTGAVAESRLRFRSGLAMGIRPGLEPGTELRLEPELRLRLEL